MNASKNQANKIEDTTKKSLEEGNKAIEMNKKLGDGSDDKNADKKEKKDEEEWRNEG
jgi:hypothetical protein